MLTSRDAPQILVDAMSSWHWPRGRIRGAILQHSHPVFQSTDFELLQKPGQLDENHIATTESLVRFSQAPNLGLRLGLVRGSEVAESTSLPLLDVEQVLVFGGGADIGDDFWLTLDFRTSSDDPRVVGNAFGNHSCIWFEITPAFSDFCRLLRVPTT